MTCCHHKPRFPITHANGGHSSNLSPLLRGRQDIRERLERPENPNNVRLSKGNEIFRNELTANLTAHSRSQQSEGHKTKWQERMKKTQKELAVKKLQQELRQEKEDERRR